MHYLANKVRRQFRLDQNILDDLSAILESATSVRPFLRPSSLKFWSKCLYVLEQALYSSHYTRFAEEGSLYRSDTWVLAGCDDFV